MATSSERIDIGGVGGTVSMLWQMSWGLSIGFLLSAILENGVSRHAMSKMLPDASPRSVLHATLLGAVRGRVRTPPSRWRAPRSARGANFAGSMIFEFAATNLVVDLAIVMAWLISWPFAAAAALCGVVMIAVLTMLLRWLMPRSLEQAAIEQAKRGIAGRMEGHADMPMAESEGNCRSRLFAQGLGRDQPQFT
ncbi:MULTISPECIES: permease [unclassified Caballeronia]|uniref:permease n=1 Tax=unclassified Caballeronia TaxID=2646786 RepID=UPI0028659186|nr:MULTISPECIES: permease [unclassified Caballeronia]MDR5755208.1 permease [Caballeronia sp. LZ024]MDR5845346.1 permease [Caballeronia sp. LZ031]